MAHSKAGLIYPDITEADMEPQEEELITQVDTSLVRFTFVSTIFNYFNSHAGQVVIVGCSICHFPGCFTASVESFWWIAET